MNRTQYIFIVILIAGMSSLNPVAIDTFLPAMPEIAKAMAVDPGTIGVTIGIFTLGTALGQISIGPLSDRFGRKPVMCWGLVLFVVTGLLSTYAVNVETLSAIRFLQGISAASGRILGVAIVRDIYKEERAAKLLSNIWTVGSIMPMLNPFIGSILLLHFQWSSVFIYMAVFGGLILALALLVFKETLPQKNHSALQPGHLLINFGQIASDRTFIMYTASVTFASSALYGFLAAASDLLITQLQQTPTVFAYEFALVMLGGMTGSFISGRLSVKLGIKRMLSIGVTITTIFSLILLVLALNGVFSATAIILPFALFRIGDAMISAQSMAGALSPFPDRAGAASSLLGFTRQMVGATVAILVGVFADGTALPMAVAISCGGIVPAGIYLLFIRKSS